jgi:hypothetical protein
MTATACPAPKRSRSPRRWAARGIHSFPVAISWDDRKQSTNKRPLTGEGGFRNGTTDPVERSWPFQSFSA